MKKCFWYVKYVWIEGENEKINNKIKIKTDIFSEIAGSQTRLTSPEKLRIFKVETPALFNKMGHLYL